MVERVFLGAVTQVMPRLAPGVLLQALVPNDGEHQGLAQGALVHAYLPPYGLRGPGRQLRRRPRAGANLTGACVMPGRVA